MSEPFIGQLMLFGGNFAPAHWALCNGPLLSISQNNALFSLLGTTYGGDGVTTFGLPNFQGTVAVSQGTSTADGNNYIMGQQGGVQSVTLTVSTMPAHTHTLQATAAPAVALDPAGALYAAGQQDVFTNQTDSGSTLSATTVQVAGGGQPHSNLMPFLVLTFVIALVGIYPSRS